MRRLLELLQCVDRAPEREHLVDDRHAAADDLAERRLTVLLIDLPSSVDQALTSIGPKRSAGNVTRHVWLVPSLLALHNLEEALTMRDALPRAREHAPAFAQTFVADVSYETFLRVLVVVTVVPVLVALWVSRRPSSAAARWSLSLVQAVVALNVVSHVASAIALRGYGPGLVTAIACNAPFSIEFFRRIARERWLSRRARWALAPAAVIVHGPLLIALFAIARSP